MSAPSVSRDRWIAAALALGSFLLLLGTERAVGFTRDESVYFNAAENYASWYAQLAEHPLQALQDGAISRVFEENREHPVLWKTLFGLSERLFHRTLGWTRPATAFRLPAFAIAALIPALLYLWGRRLASSAAGLFAALSFFAVPRQFFHAHLACFDMPVAAMWLATVFAFARALRRGAPESAEAARHRRRWAWACGVLFGLALATKHNAFFLPVVLFPFALATAWVRTRARPLARTRLLEGVSTIAGVLLLFGVLVLVQGPLGFVQHFELLSPGTALWAGGLVGGAWLLRRLRAENVEAADALLPVATMTLLGPLILYLHWPFLWHHPIERIAWYLEFHRTHNHYAWMYLGTLLREPPFPLDYVVVVTALTVPLSLGLPMVLGFGGALVDAVRRRSHAWEAQQEQLLVLAHALTSIVLISLPDVPHFGGVKHWFPSMPFLALLGGVAFERAAQEVRAWAGPGPGSLAAPVLGGLLLLPAVLDTARIHPYGTSAYAELAGDLPGAASLGMQRQYWSSNVTGVFDYLNAHAPSGARIWLHEVNGYSFRDYQRNGMLRADLRPANGPEDAALAAYQYHQEFREQELQIWNAFETQRPVAGLYLEETPQVVVYARPGVLP